MTILCLGVIGVFFSIQVFSLIAQFLKDNKKQQIFSEWPKVSVLLAARNEEHTILRCLKALEGVDYPSEKFEVLIGNDASSDKTADIVNSFIKGKSNYKQIEIKNPLGKALGKANVLAHLAHAAQGEFYFITDCDVAVSRGWVKSLLKCFTPTVGLASGTTKCEPGNWAATLQSIDWLHFMGYIKSFANIGVSCTSVGNNMAVRATAYWQTGGYENIDFSITEDYKLFKEVTSKGWGWRNILNPESLGMATYVSSLTEIMHQRKRWLMGARELPWNWKTLILIYGAFIPALMGIAWYFPRMALGIWVLKFSVQSFFIFHLNKKTKTPGYPFYFYFAYEVYLLIMTVMTAIFHVLPVKSVWKGRTYGKKALAE